MSDKPPLPGDYIEPVVHDPDKVMRLLVTEDNLAWCRSVVAAGHWVVTAQTEDKQA